MSHDIIRKSNEKVTKNIAEIFPPSHRDPIAIYNGCIAPYEDSADYVKVGVIKAVRLG